MKAMIGAGVDPRTLQLLDEIRALRQRVAELEDALAEAASIDEPQAAAQTAAAARREPAPAS